MASPLRHVHQLRSGRVYKKRRRDLNIAKLLKGHKRLLDPDPKLNTDSR